MPSCDPDGASLLNSLPLPASPRCCSTRPGARSACVASPAPGRSASAQIAMLRHASASMTLDVDTELYDDLDELTETLDRARAEALGW